MKRVLLRMLTILFCLSLPVWGLGCGYHLQGTKNPLVKLGIHKIYVEGFRNRSYRPGIEHYFTTAMTRKIQRSRIFELASSKDDADAILSGTITALQDSPQTGPVQVDQVTTENVATSFNTTITCLVILRDQRTKRILFSDSVGGEKAHPASLELIGKFNNQPANATAPLINESEERLAIRYVSDQMMTDAFEKIVGVF